MKRNTLISLIASLTLLYGIGLAQATTVLRFSQTDSAKGPREAAAKYFAKKVDKLTDGRYKVHVYCCSVLGNDPQDVRNLTMGGIAFTVSATGSYASYLPNLNLLMMPYLVSTYKQGWALYDSPWVKKQFAKAPKKGFRFLATWEAGFRDLTMTKPVRNDSQAKGMTIRSFPNHMMDWTLAAMGFKVKIMPINEVYMAIQQGDVQGQENPIPTIYSLKFYQVARYISLTRHVYSPIPLAVSEKIWKKIDPKDQKAIEKAAKMAAVYSRHLVLAKDAKEIKAMEAKGAKIIHPNIASFRTSVKPVYKKAEKVYGKKLVEQLLSTAARIRKQYPAKTAKQ